MSQRLSVSVIFQALAARVSALEMGSAVTEEAVAGALGYTPANQAGDTFGGNITAPNIRTHTAGRGAINSAQGDATHTGTIEFVDVSSARQAYIGYTALGGALNYHSDNGAGHYFDGGLVRISTSADEKLRMGGTDNPYINAFSIDSTQIGYLQWTKGNLVANLVGVNGASLWAGGSPVLQVIASGTVLAGTTTFGDANFYALLSGSVPQIVFDVGDAYFYDRTANQHKWSVGGATKMVLDTNGLILPGGLTAPAVSLDSAFYMSANSGAPLISFDNNDYLSYDRTGNQLNLTIGGSPRLTVTAAELHHNTQISAPNIAIDGQFYSAVASGSAVINFDSTDWIAYDRASNTFGFIIGATQRAAMSSSQFQHTGALIAGSYIQCGDANFFLQIANAGVAPEVVFDSGGDLLAYSRSSNLFTFSIAGTSVCGISAAGLTANALIAPSISVDANFSMLIASSKPQLTFDANDALTYDRAANSYSFGIGGSAACNITSTGVTANGISAPTISVDATFFANIVASKPRITFDTGNYLSYDRSAHEWQIVTAGQVHTSISGQPGAGFVQRNLVRAGFGAASVQMTDTIDPTNRSGSIDFMETGNSAQATIYANITTNKLIINVNGSDVASIDGAGNMRILGTLTQNAVTL